MPTPRAHTKTQKLYAVLSDGQWHTPRELARHVGHTFGGAVFKLRQAGHIVHARPHPSKLYQWQYRIKSD